ncbi:MAG: PEGA domain-containing protein [Vicinamibacterales bacterium]
MKRFTCRVGILVAGLALAASPALAQRTPPSGSASGGDTAVARGSGGSSGASSGGTAVPSSAGMATSGGANSGVSVNSPSAGAAMAPSMRSTSMGLHEAAPQRRIGGSAPAATSRSTGERATPRVQGAQAAPANSGARTRPSTSPTSAAVPSWARARGSNPGHDTAVARTVPPRLGNPAYYGAFGYYPYYGYGAGYYNSGFGSPYGFYEYDPFYGPIYYPFFTGFGLGTYPYFDPMNDLYGGSGDPYNYGAGSYSTSQNSADEGSLKLKVKPRDAKVYVDGYLVGTVDNFDGAFQKLPLTAGRHKIRVEAPGYQADEFDAVITPQQTVTFEGDLKKVR